MKVFVDSSILIEYLKGTRTDLLEALAQDRSIELCINNIVVSEYIFKFLAISLNKSPLAIKESKQIAKAIENSELAEFLSIFSFVKSDKKELEISIDLMRKFNLLPNDALILAACKTNKINYLASFDSDYIDACTSERIKLISKAEDLENLK